MILKMLNNDKFHNIIYVYNRYLYYNFKCYNMYKSFTNLFFILKIKNCKLNFNKIIVILLLFVKLFNCLTKHHFFKNWKLFYWSIRHFWNIFNNHIKLTKNTSS